MFTCQIVLKQRRNPFDSDVEGRNSGKNEGESLNRRLLPVPPAADYAFILKVEAQVLRGRRLSSGLRGQEASAQVFPEVVSEAQLCKGCQTGWRITQKNIPQP